MLSHFQGSQFYPCYILIDSSIIDEYGVDNSTASIIVNNFHFIKELIAWCFVTYDDRNEVYKANIRSRGPVINEIANKYNGGGHNFAAGARIVKKSDVESLFKDLDAACEKYLDREEQWKILRQLNKQEITNIR